MSSQPTEVPMFTYVVPASGSQPVERRRGREAGERRIHLGDVGEAERDLRVRLHELGLGLGVDEELVVHHPVEMPVVVQVVAPHGSYIVRCRAGSGLARPPALGSVRPRSLRSAGDDGHCITAQRTAGAPEQPERLGTASTYFFGGQAVRTVKVFRAVLPSLSVTTAVSRLSPGGTGCAGLWLKHVSQVFSPRLPHSNGGSCWWSSREPRIFQSTPEMA